MPEIRSKRHPIKFHLSLILGTLFYLAMAAVCIYDYVDEEAGSHVKIPLFLLPFFALLLIILACYTITRYYKNAPIIHADDEGLTVNGERYFFRDIKVLELTGKHVFPTVISFRREGAELIFKNGKKLYIFDDMYTNSGEIKTLIFNATYKKRTTDYPAYRPDHSAERTVYNGSLFLSMHGWLFFIMLGLTIFTIVTLVQKEEQVRGFTLFMGAMLTFWIVLTALLTHYFEIDQNKLIIRDHIFFWKKHEYELSEVKEIVLEAEGRSPNGLRVIRKDFKSKLYRAGTLRDKTWIRLKADLRTRNIKVKDELYIGNEE